MYITIEGTISGYVERRSKDNKVYRSVDLYVKGRDPGTLRVNIPEDGSGLAEQCRQAEGRQGRVLVELRRFEQTGRIFFDLVKLELVNGASPTGSAAGKH